MNDTREHNEELEEAEQINHSVTVDTETFELVQNKKYMNTRNI